VHLTQVVQAEAIKTGSMHWRSRMMKCSGALYWQLNDCWPVISWAACDYARRPKGLYYYSKRFFAPVAAWAVNRPEGIFGYVINDSVAKVAGEVALQAMTFDGNEVGCIRENVELPPNSVHTVGPVKAETLGILDPASVFLMVTFRPADGEAVGDIGFMMRPKHLKLPKPKLTWKVKAADGGVKILLATKNLAYGVYLRIPWSEAKFLDNFLTIPPGGTAEVEIRGRHLSPSAVSRKLKVMWVKGTL
jgi:beta-mannosidase